MRPPVHVLLRQSVREAGGSPLGRPIRDIVPVKLNLPGVLRKELARPTWTHEHVVVGTATDPYQPAEGHYRLTRAAIETLGAARNPFSMITRGPMIVRDIDALTEAGRRAPVAVTFSIPTLDRDVWRKTEPGTAPPRQRLRALAELVDAGIEASVGMAPILPGLSDDPRHLADVVRAARDAGATAIWTNVLHLRPGTREHFLDHLARDWPELLPRYERLYAGRAYVAKADQEPIRREVADLRGRFEIADRRKVRLLRVPLPPGAEQLELPLDVDAEADADEPHPARRAIMSA